MDATKNSHSRPSEGLLMNSNDFFCLKSKHNIIIYNHISPSISASACLLLLLRMIGFLCSILQCCWCFCRSWWWWCGVHCCCCWGCRRCSSCCCSITMHQVIILVHARIETSFYWRTRMRMQGAAPIPNQVSGELIDGTEKVVNISRFRPRCRC